MIRRARKTKEVKMQSILFIYWVDPDFSLVKNVRDFYNDKGYHVEDVHITHLQHTNFGRKLHVKNSTNFLNIVYLIVKILVLNIKSLRIKEVYILGNNAIYASILKIIINPKSVIVHYNETPVFVENPKSFRSAFERIIYSRIKFCVVSNHYRSNLIANSMQSNARHFILDNILHLPMYDDMRPSVNNYVASDNKKIVLCYVGVINKNRYLYDLVNLVSLSSVFDLLIMGPIAPYDHSMSKLLNNSKNVKYLGCLSQSEVLQQIKQYADVGIAFYTLDSLNNKYCAPLKIHEFFHYSKPIITLNNPPLVDIEKEYKISISINSVDELASSKKIIQIKKIMAQMHRDDFYRFESEMKSEFVRSINDLHDKRQKLL